MKKLALNVDQLKVQSFEVQQASQERGTVNAYVSRAVGCSVGCSNDEETCAFTCEYTCETGICFC